MRLFKVLRMKRVELLEETFEGGRRIPVEEVYDSKPQTETQEVVFIVDKKEAYRVYDRFEEEEITLLPDGDFRITLRAPLDDWVYGMILSFGPSARVISPENAKEEMIQKIQDMGKKYL